MEKQLIPQLRFPDFEEDWGNLRLGDLGVFKGGGTPSTTNVEYWDGDIPWISSSDVKEKDIINIDITRYLSVKAVAESATKLIPKNSVLFVSRVGVGKLFVSKEDLCTSQDFANLIPKKDNSYFVAYYFLSRNKLLHQYAQGTSIKGFTTGDLKSIPVSIPSLPEQQKIASFLTDVDNKITKLTKKAALLEQYKKGIMQKIFNQELRFKDDEGNIFPDWEVKKLGDIGAFQTSSVDKLSKPDEKEVYLVNYMNVYRHEKISNETVKSFQIVTANENQLTSSNLSKGDILFTPSSETPTDIGHSVVIFENIIDAVYSYHLIRFRPKIKLDLMFSHYFCNTSKVLRQLSRFATGSTRFTISIGNFSKVKACYPCIEEQTKIANFLSDIDVKIEALNANIENNKSFKKGLLQQMFV